MTDEVVAGLPVLTLKERQLLHSVFNVRYDDASRKGVLTKEEWAKLKIELSSIRDNLTGSNQLQTVQLQRALTIYNKNYETMTNAQSKIYSLLKDVAANIK